MDAVSLAEEILLRTHLRAWAARRAAAGARSDRCTCPTRQDGRVGLAVVYEDEESPRCPTCGGEAVDIVVRITVVPDRERPGL